jgi:hypothetical protein
MLPSNVRFAVVLRLPIVAAMLESSGGVSFAVEA